MIPLEIKTQNEHMDRPISQNEQNKGKRKQWLRWALIAAGLIAAIWLLRYLLNPSVEADKFRFATVERGLIENAITANGLVIPASEQIITAPTASRIQKVLLTSGADVETNDLILELDEEFVRLEYDQLNDQLKLRKNKVSRLTLEYDKNLRELELDDSIKGLQVSSLKAQLADMKRLKGIGGATQEEVDQASLSLSIAGLEKKKLENDLAFRKAVVTNDRSNLQLEVQIQEKKLRELGRKLKETRVVAPESGVITWVSEDIGKNVAEGEMLVRLANLSSFRVEGTVSDLFADQIKVGLPVKVRINQEDLPGRIISILPAVTNNTIAFNVALEDPSNQALRPSMQTELFIVTRSKEDALRVPNGPAFTGAREQEVFVVEGDKAYRRRLRVVSSLDYMELVGDIRPGERVIISDMQDYRHLEVIELKQK
ncbi:MAG: HlyD family efflux transporter periplasmic adaptor subunit [Bacteroidota bacterium]